VSRPTWDTTRALQDFAYGAVTLFRRTFQNVLLSIQVSYRSPATPSDKSDGLDCSAFARHYLRNHCCFLFLRLLRCFTSPGFALEALFDSDSGDRTLLLPGFPIRTSPDQSLFAAPRSLSQLTTSFIAYQCQGIHRAPLVA
jgi:hypothetical protein